MTQLSVLETKAQVFQVDRFEYAVSVDGGGFRMDDGNIITALGNCSEVLVVRFKFSLHHPDDLKAAVEILKQEGSVMDVAISSHTLVVQKFCVPHERSNPSLMFWTWDKLWDKVKPIVDKDLLEHEK